MLEETQDPANPLPELITDRTAHLEFLKKNLAAAQNRMKLKADKNRTEKEFQLGDKVLLKL
jgi:hypothetical protein